MKSRRLGICALAVLLAAAPVLCSEASASNAKQGRDAVKAAMKAGLKGKQLSSQCAKDCFDKAKQHGFDKVAGDSTACFAPYKGKRLSTADCCDKAELLFGARGPLAHCLCCPEFTKELLQALPVKTLDITHDEYLEKMNLCRVPLVNTKGCSPGVAKERAAIKPWVPTLEKPVNVDTRSYAPAPLGGPSGRQPLQPGSNGPPFKTLDMNRPIAGQFNLTGIYPLIGFETKYSSSILAAKGREAVRDGEIELIQVAGASEFYNQYMTGFMMYLEEDTPRYNTPIKSPKLPPLPAQYKDDVAWVANLRRGPYPDLLKNRPPATAPSVTDPLQNGQIASMSPGVVFAGRVPAFNSP